MLGIQGTQVRMNNSKKMNRMVLDVYKRTNKNNRSLKSSPYIPGLIGKILYQDSDMMIFSNIQSPFAGNRNPTKPNQPEPTLINPATAGMSAVHLLVIPKKYIFNAVAITPDDAELVRKMKEIGVSVAKATTRFLFKSRESVFNGLKVPELKMLVSAPGNHANPKDSDFLTGFHVAPVSVNTLDKSHSTGHLHMHVVYTPWRVEGQSTYNNHSHASKFVSVNTVLESLGAGKAGISEPGMDVVAFNTRRSIFTTLRGKPNGEITDGELKMVTKGLITGGYNAGYNTPGYMPFAEFAPGSTPLKPENRAARLKIRQGLQTGAYMKTMPFKAYTDIIRGKSQ